jgi:hypothetical protein
MKNIIGKLNKNTKLQAQKITKQTTVWFNNLLASDFHHSFEKWVGKLIDDTPTIYGKAIDKNYILTHIGSWKHRLFDGSHTPHQMWEKVKETLPDDSRLEEVKAYFLEMAKDLQTPAGLPIYTASKEGFDKAAKYLSDTYGIPSSWLYDIQTINLAELLGSLVSIFAILFHWNKKDKEIFGDIASSLMVSGLIGGNPLVIIASLVTMARAYTLNNKKFTYNSFRTGFKKGGIGTGVFIATVYTISGPVWIGLVTGLVISIITRKYIGKISLKQISDWFIINLKKGVRE